MGRLLPGHRYSRRAWTLRADTTGQTRFLNGLSTRILATPKP